MIYDSGTHLAGQEIRLLEIIPSKIVSHLLQCRLFRISLDETDRYPYEALSYVWGDVANIAKIYCNGELISITSSLADALRRLRLPQKSRFIWADALCIDQSSVSEKNCQIPLMGKIYSMARRVVVWLGASEPDGPEGIQETVQRLASHIRVEMDKREGSLERSTNDYSEIQMPPEYTSTTTRDALRRLYARSWFSRIWCVQEIVLAKDAIMLWGEHEFPWEHVGMIAAWVQGTQPTRANEFDDDAFYADIPKDAALSMFHIQRESHNLIELLDSCDGFGATNPRDKVYGVLSIAYPKEEAQRLCVDYDKSVGEVYADAVVAHIQHNAHLYPLCFVDHGSSYQPSDDEFTSWTPRWLQRPRRIPAQDSPLTACKDIPVSWVAPRDVNSKQLCLEGIFYSRIDRVQAEMKLNNLAQGQKHPFMDIYSAILGGRNKEWPEDLERMGVLARTLTAGCDSSFNDLDNAGTEEKVEFVMSFLRSMSCLASGGDYNSRKVTLGQESFYGEAEIVCTGRRVFHTATGDFGLGPAAARPGDIVVVLFGGDSPYILRPHNRSYLFIGHAYIDSLMKGQLVDMMEMGIVCRQEFRLV